MPTKEQLIDKLTDRNKCKTFTKHDLFSLMSKCKCEIKEAGRGSAVKFCDKDKKNQVIFDLPHPHKELYPYQRKLVIDFLIKIGEIK